MISPFRVQIPIFARNANLYIARRENLNTSLCTDLHFEENQNVTRKFEMLGVSTSGLTISPIISCQIHFEFIIEHCNCMCLLPDIRQNGWFTLLHSVALHIWLGTPGDEADVPATKLPLTYRISTFSLPLQSCRSWMQRISPSKYDDTIVMGAAARMSKSGTWAAAL